MSGATPYPLAALLAVRECRQALARAGVARALADLSRRSAAREAAQQLAAERRDDARRIAASVSGIASASAGDLGRTAAFAARLRAEAWSLAGAARREETALRRAEEELIVRRGDLCAARAALRAVERHHERWRDAAARARERRGDSAEEDAFSAWRAAR